MYSHFFLPTQPGGNEYAWDGEGRVRIWQGFDFFIPNGKYSVSNINVGWMFVCLTIVGLVVTYWNRFFFAVYGVWFSPTIYYLLILTSYFFFFVFLKKIFSLNYFGLFFNQLIDLTIGSFTGNTIVTFHSERFKLVLCLPIGLLNLIFLQKI